MRALFAAMSMLLVLATALAVVAASRPPAGEPVHATPVAATR